MTTYDDAMVAERITISINAELARALRASAEHDTMTVSAWAADAFEYKLEQQSNRRRLNDVITEWEAEHGAFTEEELERARRDLGW